MSSDYWKHFQVKIPNVIINIQLTGKLFFSMSIWQGQEGASVINFCHAHRKVQLFFFLSSLLYYSLNFVSCPIFVYHLILTKHIAKLFIYVVFEWRFSRLPIIPNNMFMIRMKYNSHALLLYDTLGSISAFKSRCCTFYSKLWTTTCRFGVFCTL